MLGWPITICQISYINITIIFPLTVSLYDINSLHFLWRITPFPSHGPGETAYLSNTPPHAPPQQPRGWHSPLTAAVSTRPKWANQSLPWDLIYGSWERKVFLPKGLRTVRTVQARNTRWPRTPLKIRRNFKLKPKQKAEIHQEKEKNLSVLWASGSWHNWRQLNL